MAVSHVEILAAVSKVTKVTYFQVLGLPAKYATRAEVKNAFHSFAEKFHPDQYYDAPHDVQLAAKTIFKRGVEAYEVLRDSELQTRYVKHFLKKGMARLTPEAFNKAVPVGEPASSTRIKVVKEARWSDRMKTSDGKEVAERIEKLIAEGRFQVAFQQLGILESIEPGNQAVEDKLNLVRRRLAAN